MDNQNNNHGFHVTEKVIPLSLSALLGLGYFHVTELLEVVKAFNDTLAELNQTISNLDVCVPPTK